MPKVTLTRSELLDATASSITAAIAQIKGKDKFAQALGFTEKTYYCRKDQPERYTLAELRKLYRFGKLTDDEFLLMIRTDDEKNVDPTLKWRR